MLHDILNQLEEASSEFGVRLRIILDHAKGRVAKADQDSAQVARQRFSHPFNHC